MKHYREYEELTTKKEFLKTTCDRCDSELPHLGHYNVRTLELGYSEGKTYHDGGYGEGWFVEDLCSDCVEFLKQWLIDNGFKIQDYDW